LPGLKSGGAATAVPPRPLCTEAVGRKAWAPCFSDILVTGQLTATPTHGLDSGHFTGKPTRELDNSVTMQF